MRGGGGGGDWIIPSFSMGVQTEFEGIQECIYNPNNYFQNCCTTGKAPGSLFPAWLICHPATAFDRSMALFQSRNDVQYIGPKPRNAPIPAKPGQSSRLLLSSCVQAQPRACTDAQ